MSKINIGKHGKDNVELDLDILLRTRLLIQSNSGGGKSFTIRRFAEETFGKVPLIIIDPEGEFATLREKFGFVLVGKGGETPADPRSAALLAHKLLELRASAICDIYELKPQTRHHWVKLFLESLVDAPKKLWRPTIVVVDEAHVYCPEKGQGESEAFGAMADLVTRGRKRGFCAVFATQRLAKLSKNVSAEMLNRLIGQTFEDVDQERAADLLSVPRADRAKFFADMRVIDPGYFWALGRAIAKTRVLVKVGPVATTHPEPGSASFSAEPPPAPAKVRELLPKLADLPQAAEEQAKTVAELKREIITLKRQLREQPAAANAGEIKLWQNRAAEEAKRHLGHIASIERKLKPVVEKVQKSHQLVEAAMVRVRQTEDDLFKVVSEIAGIVSQRAPSVSQIGHNVQQERRFVSTPIVTTPPAKFDPTLERAGSIRVDPGQNGRAGDGLTGPEQRILDAIAWQNALGIDEPAQVAVAFLANYTYGTGAFNNARGSLRSKGLVEYRPGDRIVLTFEGKKCAQPPDVALTTEELHRRVLAVLEKPHQKILKPLLDAYPRALSNEDLAPLAGYKPGVGAFNNPKGRLRTLGLIEYPQPNQAVASSILFLD
jgi:hypothetical protein